MTFLDFAGLGPAAPYGIGNPGLQVRRQRRAAWGEPAARTQRPARRPARFGPRRLPHPLARIVRLLVAPLAHQFIEFGVA
ncbi:MAG: hypothetical protein WAL40_10835, partial [Rhodoplanes sp.]